MTTFKVATNQDQVAVLYEEVDSNQGIQNAPKKPSRKTKPENSLKDDDFYTKSKPRKRFKQFRCTVCKKSKAFCTQKQWDRHVENAHNKKDHERITCSVCNVSLKSAYFYERHMLTRHPNNPRIYTCDYDGRTFELKDYLRVHMDRHRTHQIYTCEICQKSYVSRHTFRRHLKMHIEKHVCSECGQTFGTKINLENHFASKHTEDLSISCNYCTRLFPSKTARNNHHYMAHKNKSELNFKCHQCNIYFEMKEELRIHSFIHFNGEIKTCPECNQIFKTFRLLNVHMHKHETSKSFQCSECGDLFTFKTGLAKHIRLNRCKGPLELTQVQSQNPDEADVGLSFTAEEVAKTQLESITRQRRPKKRKVEVVIAQKETKVEVVQKPATKVFVQKIKQEELQINDYSKETRKHRKQTFPVKFRTGRAHLIYTCDLCGDEIKYMKGIKDHMKSHVSIDRFQCKECQDNFKNRKSLVDHLLTVHDIKTSVILETYSCDTCDRKFDSKSRFEGHKLSHDESARNLSCKICCATFKTTGNLHRHEATHVSTRDFHCEPCSKSFKTKIGLNVHRETVHPDYQVLVECPICGSWVKEKNLKIHNKNQHSEDSKQKLFSCTICHKTFKTQKLGERHFESVHYPQDKGVVYSCPDCPEQFYRQRHLKEHAFTHFEGVIYQCETCLKMFKNKRLLRIHCNTMHNETATVFPCGFCAVVLKTRSGRQKHIKNRHAEDSYYQSGLEKLDSNTQM